MRTSGLCHCLTALAIPGPPEVDPGHAPMPMGVLFQAACGIDLAPGTGLLGLAALERDLSEILDAKVDVVPAGDLEPGVAGEVLAEAVPL